MAIKAASVLIDGPIILFHVEHDSHEFKAKTDGGAIIIAALDWLFRLLLASLPDVTID
jgi:hypothetical protein